MARLELEVNADALHVRMQRIKSGVAGPEMLEAAGHYMSHTGLPMRFREGGPGWAPVSRGGSPLRDTGALSKSFAHSVRLSDRAVIVSSNSIYAGPQHRGDTIRPKGKYLAIPLSTLSISQRRTKGPRDFKNTRIFQSKKGNLLVWRQKGTKPYVSKSTGIRPMTKPGKPVPVWEPIFALKPSVKLTARRFMFFSDENVSAIKRRMTKTLRFYATGEGSAAGGE